METRLPRRHNATVSGDVADTGLSDGKTRRRRKRRRGILCSETSTAVEDIGSRCLAWDMMITESTCYFNFLSHVQLLAAISTRCKQQGAGGGACLQTPVLTLMFVGIKTQTSETHHHGQLINNHY